MKSVEIFFNSEYWELLIKEDEEVIRTVTADTFAGIVKELSELEGEL